MVLRSSRRARVLHNYAGMCLLCSCIRSSHTLAVRRGQPSDCIFHQARTYHPPASSEFDRHTRSHAEMRSRQTGPPMWHRDMYTESGQARSDPCEEGHATPLRSSVRGSFLPNIPARFAPYPSQGLCRARQPPAGSMFWANITDIRAYLSASSSLWVRITSAVGPSGSLSWPPFLPICSPTARTDLGSHFARTLPPACVRKTSVYSHALVSADYVERAQLGHLPAKATTQWLASAAPCCRVSPDEP
ncbi:hypothetical protein GY45DRAFT_637777 [Cubamyces sp. BRFM 1775]|nr:hypothetical protein GY45DRAFT_637777 [Cubamyces sp. BRFM 1775]